MTVPYGRIYGRDPQFRFWVVIVGKGDEQSRRGDGGAQLERLQIWIKTKEREA